MESDSKTSSEDESSMDVVRPDGASSAPKFYECVFCKRGFTTAQALGGHMNIHRKDRVKPGRITSSRVGAADEVDDELINFNFFSPPPYSMFGEVNSGDYRFFPSAGRWGLVSPPDVVEGSRTCLNLIGGEDWPAALSLRIGPPSMADDDDDDKKLGEDGLDLELRLGHDP